MAAQYLPRDLVRSRSGYEECLKDQEKESKSLIGNGFHDFTQHCALSVLQPYSNLFCCVHFGNQNLSLISSVVQHSTTCKVEHTRFNVFT